MLLKKPMKKYVAFILLLACLSLGLTALHLAHIINKAQVHASLRTLKNDQTFRNANNSIVKSKLHQERSCNAQDFSLNGPVEIDFSKMEEAFDAMNSTQSGSLGQFGKSVFEPTKCKATLSIAIIVPFRDRDQHLRRLLGHLHPILSRQNLRYQIFVVEQLGNDTFNKGRLMNTGYKHASKISQIEFDCYIFHDVDLLSENDRNIYRCFPDTNFILHLSCAIDKFRYHPLCCGMTVGGVLSFSTKQFQQNDIHQLLPYIFKRQAQTARQLSLLLQAALVEINEGGLYFRSPRLATRFEPDAANIAKVNGFSNSFWGWGGEDDDMNQRIKEKGFRVKRPYFSTCRYTMIPHERDKMNPYNKTSVDSKVDNFNKEFVVDGLNNLRTNVVSVQKFPLFVKLLVDVGHRILSTQPSDQLRPTVSIT